METGETPEQSLCREIKEELETEISVDQFVTTVNYDYPNFHLTMHCFLCSIKEGNLTLLEDSAAKWLDMKHIDSVDWLPADVEVINQLKKYSKTNSHDIAPWLLNFFDPIFQLII